MQRGVRSFKDTVRLSQTYAVHSCSGLIYQMYRLRLVHCLMAVQESTVLKSELAKLTRCESVHPVRSLEFIRLTDNAALVKSQRRRQ